MNGPDDTPDQPLSVEQYTKAAQTSLDRVRPRDLTSALADGAFLVDTREAHYRAAEGDMPGAVVVERNQLEWRVVPDYPFAIERDPNARVIVMCNDGYSSAVAANCLRMLGLDDATDLEGGYRGWRRWLEEKDT